MKRSGLALAAAVLPLLAGCTGASLPVAQSTLVQSPVESGAEQGDRWTWSCPQSRTRIIVPGMAGLPTAHDAAHFFSGKEQAQLHRVRPGQRVAIVRGIEGLGPSRLHLYRMRGEWYVNQIKTCERRP